MRGREFIRVYKGSTVNISTTIDREVSKKLRNAYPEACVAVLGYPVESSQLGGHVDTARVKDHKVSQSACTLIM